MKEKKPKITIYEKFVWLIVSFNANDEGKTTMSIQDMAEEATCSTARVKKAIETLIEHGWLEMLGVGIYRVR